jgi:ABC-type branched-subunit amino acid transport system substrate-binding protein
MFANQLPLWRRLGILTAAVTLFVAVAACGRSSNVPTGPGASTTGAASKLAPSSSAVAAGEFGSLKKVCAPGPGTGGSGRGIEGKAIHVGVLGDPGAAAAPGLGQEFFDVANAFTKWCNAAGGINGRTIVVDTLDAKLFDGAAKTIAGCHKDFMLVGGTTALDATTVKAREGCKLGSIPAYTASPEAYSSKYQVTPEGSPSTVYPVAPLRLLADAYPDTKQGLGVASSNLASLRPQGLRAQEAWRNLGYKVSTLQERPALVSNYRPWMEQLRQAGAKADFEIVATDANLIFTGMHDIGYVPEWLLFGQQFYTQKSVQTAKAIGTIPTTYTNLSNLPWELSDQFPVVQQAKEIMAANPGKADLDAFTMYAFDAWLLWAQAATECGTNLTQDCVLQKAGSRTNWDAGGLFAPLAKPLSEQPFFDCWLMMRLTANGWVYDKKITQPNKGPYNCGSQNLVPVHSYLTG